MKNKWLLMVLFVFPLALYAQENYWPLVTEGKYWKGKEVGIHADMQFDYDCFLQGDTVINGIKYVKCYEIRERGSAGVPTPYYSRAIREDERKVYGIPDGSEKEMLMFDFNMQIGDEMYCIIYNGNKPFLSHEPSDDNLQWLMRLESIDTHSYADNVSIRRFHFTNWEREIREDGSVVEHEVLSTIWAEGIGSLTDYPLNSWHLEMVSSYGYWLEECYDSTHTLYFSPSNHIKEK